MKAAADALAAALEAEPTSEAADITAAEEAATTAGAAAMAAMVRIVTADSAELEKTIMVGATAKRLALKAPFHSATPGANYRVVIARKRADVGAPAAVPVVNVFHQGGTDAAVSTEDDTALVAADAPPAIKGWHGAGFKRGTERCCRLHRHQGA